jgi:hypothetical protein
LDTGSEELDKLLINTLFEVVFFSLFCASSFHHLLDDLIISFSQVVTSESRSSPFILFMKDAEKSMVGNGDSYSTFKSKLEKLPDNVVVIGSHTHIDNRKEKVTCWGFKISLQL